MELANEWDISLLSHLCSESELHMQSSKEGPDKYQASDNVIYLRPEKFFLFKHIFRINDQFVSWKKLFAYLPI